MKFDLKIVTKGVFIAFCIAPLLLLEVADRALFRPKSIFGRTVKDFERQKSEIKILFLGQSDIKRAIIPETMSFKAYNFAEQGESFIETYYKFKYYVNEMPSLKIVVLPLTLVSFSSFRADRIGTNYYSYGFISYRDLWELYRVKGSLVIKQKLTSFSPVLDRSQQRIFWENVWRLINKKPIERTVIQDGYQPIRLKGIVNEKVASWTIQRHFRGDNIFDKDLLLYFEKILTLCHERGIKVVTLAVPMTDYYIEQAEKYITKATLYEKVFSNPKFSYYIYKHLDYLGLYAKDHSLFIDADHMNHEGATAFSRLVASDLSKVMEEIKKSP